MESILRSEMSKIGRMQWMSKRDVLKFVQGKPCVICGAPATCAVRDWGVKPVCLDHAALAQNQGYLVAFPEPIPMYMERSTTVKIPLNQCQYPGEEHELDDTSMSGGSFIYQDEDHGIAVGF